MNDRELALQTLRPLIGNELKRVEGFPGAWTFQVHPNFFINAGCNWRLFQGGVIKFCGSDHDQRFGLSKNFNVVEETTKLLQGKKLKQISIGKEAADLTLNFEGDIRVEMIQDSGGYEPWNVTEPERFQIIALGSGELAFVNYDESSTKGNE